MLVLLEPMLALFLDDTERALAAVDRWLDAPDPWTRAVLWMVRAAVRENEGDLRGAREDVTTAITGLREVGDRFALAQALTAAAEAHLAFGEPEQAVPALGESIRLIAELDPDDDAAHERILTATAHLQLGDLEEARAQCLGLTEPTRQPWSARGVAFARLVLGDIARYGGDLADAERQYDAARAAIADQPVAIPRFQALVLTSCAHFAVERGDHEAAVTTVGVACEQAISAKDMPALAKVAVAGAAVRAHFGNPTGAAKLLGVAEHLRGAPDARNPEVARLAARLRADVGDAAYDLAYAAGVALDRTEAIALVRAIARDPGPTIDATTWLP